MFVHRSENVRRKLSTKDKMEEKIRRKKLIEEKTRLMELENRFPNCGLSVSMFGTSSFSESESSLN